ncbi:helix-turn-helix domain-containing protein [Hazenella sp. IB182357]|uniref:Helix-turn-helix domain-containing protein n=1 Tax=Polycladospora coralii TaxID=2771432 RepID=A0A926NH16_9BACL|nr:helix-turn-helix domain-containing protein [Polycladospora coralii]
MHKAFKFRLYPTKEQATCINKSIGCSRFVFNHFLAEWHETYKKTGKGLTYHACAKLLTALKTQFEWLKEVDAHALQSSLWNLDDAFKRFFKNKMMHLVSKARETVCSLTQPRLKRKINFQK